MTGETIDLSLADLVEQGWDGVVATMNCRVADAMNCRAPDALNCRVADSLNCRVSVTMNCRHAG